MLLDAAVPRAGPLLRDIRRKKAQLPAIGVLRSRPGDVHDLISGGSFMLKLLLQILALAAEADHVLAGAGQVAGQMREHLAERGVAVLQLRVDRNHRL